LAYADHLEETGGDQALAELIRLQVAGKNTGPSECEMALFTQANVRWWLEPLLKHVSVRRLLIQNRRVVLDTHAGKWVFHWSRGFVNSISLPLGDFLASGVPALLGRLFPLRKIRLADRRPRRRTAPFYDMLTGGWEWAKATSAEYGLQSYEIPDTLFAYLRLNDLGYPVRDDALADLSRACVRHCREAAGLVSTHP
jgi:hypothetical protein